MNVMTKRWILFLALCWPALSWSASDSSCGRLEGEYDFIGATADESAPYPMGQEPNIAMALLPGSKLAYDSRIHRYRVKMEGGRLFLEMHGPKGPLWRVDVAGENDFSYCMDGVMVVERQRRIKTGSVYKYSRYRHVLRADLPGRLDVETEVTGKYRTWMMVWDQPKELYASHFNAVAMRTR